MVSTLPDAWPICRVPDVTATPVTSCWHPRCGTNPVTCRIPVVPLTVRSPSLPAPLLFVVSGVSMYLGAAVAVVLFDDLEPAAVAWLRLLGASGVLLAWRR